MGLVKLATKPCRVRKKVKKKVVNLFWWTKKVLDKPH